MIVETLYYFFYYSQVRLLFICYKFFKFLQQTDNLIINHLISMLVDIKY